MQAPDEDDWDKLKRVLKYLKGTLYMKLKLSADNFSTISWYVDASYGIHWDSRGHTGMMLTVGKGAAMSFSSKQKINTRSSTEAELVGIDQAFASIMWGKHFIEAQGYTVEHNILFQDNQSTILLARNGRFSSSKRTKHIKHRYFLVKDYVDRGEIEIQYRETGKMWSDVLTKPKQGKAFRAFRAILMNVPEEYDDEAERRNTHPALLPKEELQAIAQVGIGTNLKVTRHSLTRTTSLSPSHRRSVLNGTKNTDGTQWSPDQIRARNLRALKVRRSSYEPRPKYMYPERYLSSAPRRIFVT